MLKKVSVGTISWCNSCEKRIPRCFEVAAKRLAEKWVAFFVVCVEAGVRTGVAKLVNCSNQPFGVGTVGTEDDVMFAHEGLSVLDERVSDANVGVAFERDGGCHGNGSMLKGQELTVGGRHGNERGKKERF
jgi:hypothetical protein